MKKLILFILLIGFLFSLTSTVFGQTAAPTKLLVLVSVGDSRPATKTTLPSALGQMLSKGGFDVTYADAASLAITKAGIVPTYVKGTLQGDKSDQMQIVTPQDAVKLCQLNGYAAVISLAIDVRAKRNLICTKTSCMAYLFMYDAQGNTLINTAFTTNKGKVSQSEINYRAAGLATGVVLAADALQWGALHNCLPMGLGWAGIAYAILVPRHSRCTEEYKTGGAVSSEAFNLIMTTLKNTNLPVPTGA